MSLFSAYRVSGGLARACDDGASAHWFARANALLAGRTPIDVFGDGPDAVLQAARADRSAIEG